MAGASSHRCKPSCSSSRQSSSRAAGRSAQDEAADLLLPPDHQLMVTQFGERPVAALETYMEKDLSRVNFASQIRCCAGVLGESADARWQQPAVSNLIMHGTEVTPAALHASVETSCLGSAAGLQLLLEVNGLLVAEGDLTAAVQIQAFDLLLNSITGVTEAERRIFLAARGGLLVKVLQLGLQADWERKQQQQQLEGVVDPDKGTMAASILTSMAMLVGEKLAAPCYGELSLRHVVLLAPILSKQTRL